MSIQSKFAVAVAVCLTLLGAFHVAGECPGDAVAGFMGALILFGLMTGTFIVLPVALAYDAS